MSAYRLFSPTILPYHISVSEWTAKKAAILGAIFSGTSVVFLFATAVAMNWQHRSGGQKDWGMVFGVAFGVPFVCCSVAALLSFFVSVSLIAYKRFFGLRQALPVALTAVSEPPRRRVRHPAIITFAGFAVLIASAKFAATREGSCGDTYAGRFGCHRASGRTRVGCGAGQSRRGQWSRHNGRNAIPHWIHVEGVCVAIDPDAGRSRKALS